MLVAAALALLSMMMIMIITQLAQLNLSVFLIFICQHTNTKDIAGQSATPYVPTPDLRMAVKNSKVGHLRNTLLRMYFSYFFKFFRTNNAVQLRVY